MKTEIQSSTLPQWIQIEHVKESIEHEIALIRNRQKEVINSIEGSHRTTSKLHRTVLLKECVLGLERLIDFKYHVVKWNRYSLSTDSDNHILLIGSIANGSSKLLCLVSSIEQIKVASLFIKYNNSIITEYPIETFWRIV